MLETELMSYLRQRLPAYMVPSAIVPLDALPQTPNHKVDLNALPAAEQRPGPRHGAPRDGLERELADLWARLLNRDEVGVHEDVFDLDANSMHVMRLVAHVRTAYGTALPAEDVFEYPTVALLAARLREAMDAEDGGA
ncbi:phosphopantetheine-binding protein [Streptomyces sp. AJS327]|uniref:phosphopantetheine-binding protein n=1 Tax=Streptomyces sp. AJS327 TaxID=2545265 RepID=UPI001C6107D1